MIVPIVSSECRRTENERAFRLFKAMIETNLDELDDVNSVNHEIGHITNGTSVIHIKCECSYENCELHIPLKTVEYQKIHTDRDAFIVFPGHQVDMSDAVLTKKVRYSIVKKDIA